MKHTARYLDSGFYLISDKAAGALVTVIGQRLPRHGYEKFVLLTASDGIGFNAWLSRTATRHSMLAKRNARGWHWALHAIRRDGGADYPALGREITFEPASSTQPAAQFAAFHADISTP